MIPKAETIAEILITPRILIRVLIMWCFGTLVGTAFAISFAHPEAVFGSGLEDDTFLGSNTFVEFENADLSANGLASVNSREISPQKSNQEITVPPVFPTRIIIPKVGTDYAISNPETKEQTTLNNLLKKSVVRYPGSGTAGAKGNMLIFGHSSYIPSLRNSFYEEFNGIEKLVRGDEIQIFGGSGDAEKIFIYKVERVYRANATEDNIILDSSKSLLTLLTCDAYGKRSDRWVVEAELAK